MVSVVVCCQKLTLLQHGPKISWNHHFLPWNPINSTPATNLLHRFPISSLHSPGQRHFPGQPGQLVLVRQGLAIPPPISVPDMVVALCENPMNTRAWSKCDHLGNPPRTYTRKHPSSPTHTLAILNEYRFPPLNFTFNWEDQQGALGNINYHPHQTLHSIGKINKGIREYKFPPPSNFTFNWEDQQGD